ncbi:MAG: alpha/beta hydrolase family protein [Verrucomicrobiales bacterium]|nr:alpha/beta hydrolase family protein [Verrucomicrobiales bacterium]
MKPLIALVVFTSLTSSLFSQAPRVLPDGKLPADARLQDLKDLHGFFPFEVPATLADWEKRAADLRRRILVSNGLWPMPQKTPLNAVIHGKVTRPGFTVEKVYFESVPGLFVTGLLFRPENIPAGKQVPAVLSPHGHGGRLMDLGEKGVLKQIAEGGEKYVDSGRFPKVARCATLARLGAVVFLYDMMGYADNGQLSRELVHGFKKQRPDFEGKESWGLFSAQAELRLQSAFGIQTWNSIRALDFLEALPDTDPKTIGVTGGSGGGTQTIILCAIDPRPIVAFPNGMVSSSMQGGCTCENASLLRIGTGNVELAALFAPKPQGMTAANDWTKEMLIEGKGFPELQKLYGLYGKKDQVFCADLTHFHHNYNYVTRELMYNLFNKELGLGHKEPIVEKDFKRLTSAEHLVWDAQHPAPAGGDVFEKKLMGQLADESDYQLAAMSAEQRRDTVKAAWQVMIGGGGMPTAGDVSVEDHLLRQKSTGSELPLAEIAADKKKARGITVIWVDGKGKSGLFKQNGRAISEAKFLADRGCRVLSADLFKQGEFLAEGKKLTASAVVKNPRESAAYTHGYNHSVFANRAQDILSLITYAKKSSPDHKIYLIGSNGAGPVAAAALALAGDTVDKAIIVSDEFRFADITSFRDPDFIPGSVKYGDLTGLLNLATSHKVWLVGEDPSLYQAAKIEFEKSGGSLSVSSHKGGFNNAIDWLLID